MFEGGTKRAADANSENESHKTRTGHELAQIDRASAFNHPLESCRYALFTFSPSALHSAEKKKKIFSSLCLIITQGQVLNLNQWRLLCHKADILCYNSSYLSETLALAFRSFLANKSVPRRLLLLSHTILFPIS